MGQYDTPEDNIPTADMLYGTGEVSPPGDSFMLAMNQALQRLAPSGQVPIMSNDPVEIASQTQRGNPVIPLPKAGYLTPSGTQEKKDSEFDTLKTEMARISAIKDPTEKMQAMYDLEAAAGTFINSKAKTARELAEKQMGLPDLRRSLQHNEILDRQHPSWAQYMSDSTQTAAIRQRLMQMEGFVDQHANRILKEDNELFRYGKTVDNFIKLQNSLMSKAEAASLKEGAKKQTDADLLDAIRPDVRESFYKLNPEWEQNPEGFVKYLKAQKGRGGQAVSEILNGSIGPNDYVRAALGGNPVAAELAVSEQAARTGLNKEALKSQLQTAYDMVENDSLFQKNAALLGVPSNTMKEYKNKVALAGSSKEAQQDLANFRSQFVDSYLAKAQENLIMGDVAGIPSEVGKPSILQLPGATETYKELMAKTGKSRVAVNDFLTAYANQPNLTPEERSSRLDMVRGQVSASLERVRSAGLYGKNVDTQGILTRLNVQNAVRKQGDSAAARAGEALRRPAAELIDTIGTPYKAAGQAVGQAWDYTGSAVTDFLNALSGGNK